MVSFTQFLVAAVATAGTAIAAPIAAPLAPRTVTILGEWEQVAGQIGLPTPGSVSTDSTQKGRLTYYASTQGGGNGVGACGFAIDDTKPIVAISKVDYGSIGNPNESPLCNQWIKITGTETNNVAWAQVVDKCYTDSCLKGDIDVSSPVFSTISGEGTGAGRIAASWKFVSAEGQE